MKIDFLVKYRSAEEYIKLYNWLIDHGYGAPGQKHITEYTFPEHSGSHALIIQGGGGNPRAKCFSGVQPFIAAAYISHAGNRDWLTDEFIEMMEAYEESHKL